MKIFFSKAARDGVTLKTKQFETALFEMESLEEGHFFEKIFVELEGRKFRFFLSLKSDIALFLRFLLSCKEEHFV